MNYTRDASGLNIQALAPPHPVNPLRTAPNLLTLTRILLAPFLVVAVLERRFALAFGLFLLAAFTDAMDGLVARWLEQRTRLGQYLDPIADKILLSSLFLVLTRMGILEPYIAAIVFGRDIGMLFTAWVIFSTCKVRNFQPTFLGKANSFSQVVTIGMVLLSLIDERSSVQIARSIAIDTTLFLTVLSGFHYALVASRRIGEAVEEPAPQHYSPQK